MFRPGEIVIASFPFTALTGSKRRPCVVLAAGDTTDDYVVAFITTTLVTAQLPSAVLVEPHHRQWKQTGLKSASVIRADKLVTLHHSVISGAIGVSPPDILAAVRVKLKQLLQTP